MKIRFDTKLAITIVGLVSVIFMAAMALMYESEREKILYDELQDEEKELKHIAGIGHYLVDSVMPYNEVESLLESSFYDGSEVGVYNLVESDSAEIIKKELEKQYPESYILAEKLKDSDDSPVLIKTITQERNRAPLAHTMNYAIYITIFFLVLLAVAIFIVIKIHTRSEMELKKRINSELDIAKRIQNQMLPLNPSVMGFSKRVEVGSRIRPAREIGGDYYNVMRIGNHLHFIIADVSGKGIPAALFMARVADIYSMSANTGKSPAEVANEINKRLCYNNLTFMFATAIIGRLNLDNGDLEICRAGHEQPLVVPEQGVASFLETDGNLPLGLMPTHDYTMHTTTIAPNSHLLLFTDGVTEAEDANSKMFGAQNLLHAVAGNNASSPTQLIDCIAQQLRTFTGSREQSDDIAILDIKLLPTQNQKKLHLNCDLNELDKLLAFADELQLHNKVMLALEEAVVNVFNYSGASFVDVLVEKQANHTMVKITDNGQPFNPTTWMKDGAEPEMNSEGFLKVGGKGIHLIMSLMHEVSYDRINNYNVLTIKYNVKQ